MYPSLIVDNFDCNEIGFVWVARHLDDNDGNNDDDSTENEFNERTPSESGEIDLAENY